MEMDVGSRAYESRALADLDYPKWYMGSTPFQPSPVGDLPQKPLQVAKSNEHSYTIGNAQMSANSQQVGGNHYRDVMAEGLCPHCRGPIQHWDAAGQLPGLEYAATKYLWRWRLKGGLESLLKTVHYIAKIIEQNFPDRRLSFEIKDHPSTGSASSP